MTVAVVLTALPLEYDAVIARLEDVHDSPADSRIGYQVGTVAAASTLRIAVVQVAGAGNAAAALATSRAIEELAPDVVAFVGVAGATKETRLLVT